MLDLNLGMSYLVTFILLRLRIHLKGSLRPTCLMQFDRLSYSFSYSSILFLYALSITFLLRRWIFTCNWRTMSFYCVVLYCIKYGIKGIVRNWFNYLYGRKQYVMLGNKIESDTRDITCGVPQWSILGSLLFVLYMKDTVNVSTLANIGMFADNTNLFYSHSNIDELCELVDDDLILFSRWFNLNKLSLNLQKKLIVFSSTQKMKKIDPRKKCHWNR